MLRQATPNHAISRGQRFMNGLQERVLRLEQTVSIWLMAGLFVIVNIGIVTRYLFGHPIFWIEEVSNFLFIWFGFFACSTALAQNRHILIDFFISPLPNFLKMCIQLLLRVFLQIMFMCMLWPSIKAIKEFELSSALRIPEGYIFLIIPVAFTLFSFHNLFALVTDIVVLRTHTLNDPGKIRK
jgi:TRAP-type C4-dicarboxylate transport system permease small subunit